MTGMTAIAENGRVAPVARPASVPPPPASLGRDHRAPRSRDRVITGVLGGWAIRWGVEPTVLRAAVGLLTLVGGLGVALYAVGSLMSTSPSTSTPPARLPGDRRREVAIAAATLAVLLVARASGLWPGDGVMVPATFVAVAVALVWTPSRRPAPRSSSRRHLARPVMRVAAGVVLAVTGVAALAERTGGLAAVGRSTSAIAVALAGVAVVGAPALGRLLARLDDERTLRVREEERAMIAAHLHDSVLQTLVLMQRADDPQQMAGLARRQERELRAWLYGGRSLGEPTTVAAAVETLAAAIEVDHDVRVDAVTVGDTALDTAVDEAARTFLGALREAVTNAARHAGVPHVDVYVEIDARELAGFVRDTGVGFDPETIGDDRHGLADSIVGRAARAGGSATVLSRPGAGTEVEIRIPRVVTS